MIKIEVLYPEYANLYGDTGNIKYIQETMENVEVVYTSINDEPKFMSEKIDLIYLGPTTENSQEEIASVLLKYKEKIKELIEANVIFLVTGNSLELFGTHIEKLDGTNIGGLGIFDIYAKRVKDFRHNDLALGTTWDGFEIVGFKNQMSHIYGQDQNYFVSLSLGKGRNLDDTKEGIRYKNFIGTYIIGPIFALNPEFTSHIMEFIGAESQGSDIKEDALAAHELRAEEFNKIKEKRA